MALTIKSRVLAALRIGPDSASNLARTLDVPEPTIRRVMQELRREGELLNFGSGLYRLADAP